MSRLLEYFGESFSAGNRGAQSGFIEDMVFQFRSKDGKGEFYYSPFGFVDMMDFNTRLKKGGEGVSIDSLEHFFYPIFLAGKGQVAKTVVLIPDAIDFPYVPERGKYRVRLYWREARSGRWKLASESHFLFSDDLMQGLPETKSIMRPTHEFDAARTQLRGMLQRSGGRDATVERAANARWFQNILSRGLSRKPSRLQRLDAGVVQW